MLDPFQPRAAEILQKGAPQLDLKVASISTFSLASMDTEAVPVSGVSGQDLPQRESNGHRQRGKEQRELTQVQPLCMAKPLKRSTWKLVLKSGCGAPFWRIPAAHGSKRGPAPGKRYKSEVRCRWTPFWRIQNAGKAGSWNSKRTGCGAPFCQIWAAGSPKRGPAT